MRLTTDHERAAREAGMPTWLPDAVRFAIRRVALMAVVVALGIFAILAVIGRLGNVISILLTALFLSFALEPAVGYLAGRGWRRGVATGALFLAVFGVFVVIVALIVPAIVNGFQTLVTSAPELVAKFARWVAPLGIHVSQQDLIDQIRANSEKVVSSAGNVAGGVIAVTSTILGAIFKWATIGLFAFYFVAEGPKMRRAICSMLPPERQENVLFIWEEAIKQTGGYFYSRLLLALVNGAGMYITLRVTNVPFAAPLAVFEGFVAAFIPIVGTYIAGIPPVLVAFLTSPSAGVAALAYILIYQQIENYFLSPRITARTMSLHPAVAFGAAIVGGALGGFLMAFLALPAAGVIQAAVREWTHRYEVVETGLTEPQPEPEDKPGIVQRVRDGLGSGDDADPT